MFGSYDFDPLGPHYDDIHSFGGGINRGSFRQVSDRAYNALEQIRAKITFLEHLATADTSHGPVTTEIVKYHMVPFMRKQFKKFVKEYGCTGTSRQITKEEQEKINKSRQSLMWFTSVKATADAQRAYLEKNPNKARKGPTVAGSAAASTSAASTALRDVDTLKLQKKANTAASQRAASNSTLKKSKKMKA